VVASIFLFDLGALLWSVIMFNSFVQGSWVQSPEDGGSELLGSDITEVLVIEGLFGCDSFQGVVSQQFIEDVNQFLWSIW
jgi:hypothetical protein